MEEQDKKKSIMPVLRDMKIGSKSVYPIKVMASVKTVCSTCGLQWGKKFSTQVDREAGTITVTRIK